MNESVTVKHIIHTHTHTHTYVHATQHATGCFPRKIFMSVRKHRRSSHFPICLSAVTTHISTVPIFSVLCAVTICCLNLDCQCCVRLKKTKVYVISCFHKMVVNHGMERMLKEAGGVI